MARTAIPSDQEARLGQIAAARARRQSIRRWLMLSPALATIGICGLLPLAIIFAYSWMQPAEYAGVIWKFRPDAWVNLAFERDIFSGELAPNFAYYTIFARSVGMALMTTMLTLIFGLPTAYFIATQPPHRRNLWLFLITIPFWTNLLIRIYSIMMLIRDEGYINRTLMNLGLIDEPIPMIFTDGAVAFGLVYAYLPFMVLPLYASLEKLDFRLVEAAYDLYASRFQALRHVILPLIKPGIVAGAILVFIPAIGAYVIPRLLGGGKKMMFGTLIAEQFGTARNWPQGSALALALMVIVMIALIIYVRKATSAGASQ